MKKLKVMIVFIGLIILSGILSSVFIMDRNPDKKPIVIDNNGTQHDNTTAQGLNGTWEVVEVGAASQILSRYNVSVNEYNGTVYFARDAVAIGKGNHYNQTIQTETFQEWSKFGTLLISIVNDTELRAVPETNAVKWVLFVKS